MNWKTTATGAVAVLMGIGHLISHLMTGDTTMSVVWADISGIVAGVGLVFAQDAHK